MSHPARAMTSPARKPLRGVRVLSLALNLPGPAAFMRLKAMGATCTKAEPPGPGGGSGDPMGVYNPGAYAQLHDGIRTVTIDLKSDKGQAALHRHLARTDVLLTSFRPSALAKLGLAWKALHNTRACTMPWCRPVETRASSRCAAPKPCSCRR